MCLSSPNIAQYTEQLENYSFIIGIAFLVCVITGVVLYVCNGRRRKKTDHRTGLPSDPDHNYTDTLKYNKDLRGESNNNNNNSMEAFALKVARGSSCVNGRPRSSDLSVTSLLSAAPRSASRHAHGASPSTLTRTTRTRTSPGSSQDSTTASSRSSMSRVARRLFSTDSSSSSSPSSSSSQDTFEPRSPHTRTPAWLMQESRRNPHVLIGCRVFLKGRGQGTITGTVKKKFHSTSFKILFDHGHNSNYSVNPLLSSKGEELLKLQRHADKAGHEFQILPQHAEHATRR